MDFANAQVVILSGLTVVLAGACIALAAYAVNRNATAARLREAARSFRDLYDNISEGVFRSTLDGHMLSANPALVRLNGYETEAEMLNDVNDIGGRWYVDPNRRAELHQMLVEQGLVRQVASEVYRYKTRERIWIEESSRLVRDHLGNPRYYEGTVREVTDAVRRTEIQKRYEKITSIVSGCLYQLTKHADGSVSMPYASVGLTNIYGLTPEQVAVDASITSKLVHRDDLPGLVESFTVSARTMMPRQDEYRIRTLDGVEKWILGHAVPEAAPDGSITWYGYIIDISDKKRAENRIYDLAYRDTLTGLPNRAAIVETLEKALVDGGQDQEWSALLFIDLDQFKVLNDTKGHHHGDQLLCGVASRLKPLVGPRDLVARLGGDEFVVLLKGLGFRPEAAELHARRVAERIHTSIADPFPLGGFPFHTTASIGVALFRGNDLTVDELLKRADMAMYRAKAAGRGAVAFFKVEMQDVLEEHLALTTELRDALDAGKLTLAYQPQVDDSGVCFGVEALLRWNHPERGAIPPSVFVPLAERNGLGAQLDAFVLNTACETLRRWQDMPAMQHLQVAVNIGTRQLGNSVLALVNNAVHATGADPRHLTIEITEHVMLDNMEEVETVIAALKKLGIKIALDDFGTGYSSLSHLKRLSIDALKIDISFVADIETDANDRVIVQTILNIARNLGIAAIAEGVENDMQALLLRRFGCRAFQGFMYGRPMARADLELKLAEPERQRAVMAPSRLVV